MKLPEFHVILRRWMKTIELPKSSDGRLSILVRLKNLVLSQLGQQAVTQLDGFLDTHVVHNLSSAPGFLGKPIAKYTGAEPPLNRQRRIPQRQADWPQTGTVP